MQSILNIKQEKNSKAKKGNFYIMLIASCSLCACASTKNVESSPKDKSNKNSASSFVNQPLHDLGFKKNKIPSALAQITDPYATPEGFDCNAIKYQLTQLDEALGPENIRESNFDDRTLGEKSGELASDAASEAVKSAATGWIPARGLVRKLTGAEKADSSMKKAVELGKIRRGYLRGLSKAKECN